MTNKLLSALVLVILSCTANAQDRVGDFTLIDHEGQPHQLSKYGYLDALVIIAQASGCSVNHENMDRYKVISTNFEYRNIGFVMINAKVGDDRAAIRAEDAVWEYELPIMIDRTQLVAESLGIKQAGQVVVIEPSRGKLLYRGPAETSLRSAELFKLLEKITAGEVDTRKTEMIEVAMPTAESCRLDFPAADLHVKAAPDYATEVAPILIKRCTGCHVDGGIAPFAMNSHQKVQGWSPMIREVLMTKRMPPMQVDPAVKNWINSGNIPLQEVQTLVHWINAGSPRF